MRLDDGRESRHIEDRRGSGSGMPLGGRSIGIGTLVLALVAMYLGVDPRLVLESGGGPAPTQQNAPGPAALQASADPAEEALAHFVSRVLADTEDTWSELFARSATTAYRPPTLVLYRGGTRTACGMGQAAMGPFYCPGDEKVYLDLSFYQALQSRFRAPGDFAQAYVLAHEVGHHVQHLLGIADKVRQAQSGGDTRRANALQVRMELQADCFAGLWAHHAQRSRQILEAGDVDEALAAAAAIGDDALQQQARGYVVPESFTHGSAAQRVRWFSRGLEQGRLKHCDTFAVRAL